MNHEFTHIIVGGGAAGFFSAITCARHYPKHRVLILEKTKQLLTKVKISGGGRCNVTHACFDPLLLCQFYPRGHRELKASFHQFQPQDTIHWFQDRYVSLKIEEDGRVFPVSDRPQKRSFSVY